MDVTNVRANCCEHKTRVNKCRLCYNAYFQAYRKKIAEIENSKVQTRNKVYAKRSKYASVLCIDCKDLTKSNFCRECSLKYASAQMNHCRNKARQKKLMQCRGLSETVPTNATSVDQQNLQICDSEHTDNPQSKNKNEKKKTQKFKLEIK